MSTQAVSHGHSRVKPNVTVYDKLLCKNKGPLTVSDDQLPVGGKWENVDFSFPPITIEPLPFPWNQFSDSHFHETLGIPSVDSSLALTLSWNSWLPCRLVVGLSTARYPYSFYLATVRLPGRVWNVDWFLVLPVSLKINALSFTHSFHSFISPTLRAHMKRNHNHGLDWAGLDHLHCWRSMTCSSHRRIVSGFRSHF